MPDPTIPPLPKGFVLEAEPQGNAVPPLPPGFVMEQWDEPAPVMSAARPETMGDKVLRFGRGLVEGTAFMSEEDRKARNAAESANLLQAKAQGIQPQEWGTGDITTLPPSRIAAGAGRGIVEPFRGLAGYVNLKTGYGGGVEKALSKVVEALRPMNPNFADQTVEGVASTAGFMIPGIGTEAGVLRLAAWFPKVAKLAKIGGAATMAALESSGEAYNAYEENVAKGMDPAKAETLADKVFAANMVLLTATDKIGFFNAEGKFTKRVTRSMLSEATQEGGQEIIGNVATDKPLLEGVGQAAAIGGLSAGVIEGGRRIIRRMAGQRALREAPEGSRFAADRYSTTIPGGDPLVAAARRQGISQAAGEVPTPPPGFQVEPEAPAPGIVQAPQPPALAPTVKDSLTVQKDPQTGVFFDKANGRFMVEDDSGTRDVNPQNPAELEAAARLSQQAQLAAPLPPGLDGHQTQLKDIEQRLKMADAEIEGEVDAEIARQQGAQSLSKEQRRALALQTLQNRPEIAAKIQALQDGTATLKARKEQLVHGIMQAPLATGLEETDTSTPGAPDASQTSVQEAPPGDRGAAGEARPSDAGEVPGASGASTHGPEAGGGVPEAGGDRAGRVTRGEWDTLLAERYDTEPREIPGSEEATYSAKGEGDRAVSLKRDGNTLTLDRPDGSNLWAKIHGSQVYVETVDSHSRGNGILLYEALADYLQEHHPEVKYLTGAIGEDKAIQGLRFSWPSTVQFKDQDTTFGVTRLSDIVNRNRTSRAGGQRAVDKPAEPGPEREEPNLSPESGATRAPGPVAEAGVGDGPGLGTGGKDQGDAATKGAPAMAEEVFRVLSTARNPLTKERIQMLADEAFGGTNESGAWTWPQAFDAVETGLNRLLGHDGKLDRFMEWKGADKAKSAVGIIEGWFARIPTQTTRDLEKLANQQFSTPPPYAYLIARAANIQPGEVFLEPSAGTGSIATWADAAGAQVHMNEFSDLRNRLLKAAFPRAQVTRKDASKLRSLLPDLRPDVVVMNPPFSNDARTGAKDSLVGANHIEQALRMLKPGGRLIAIVGGGINPKGRAKGGMSFNSNTYSAWFDRMAKDHRILANIWVPGEVYKKMGTSFDTRVLAFEAGTADPNFRATAINAEVADLGQLADLLEKVRGVYESGRVPSEAGSAERNAPGAELSGHPGEVGRPGSDQLPPDHADDRGAGQREPGEPAKPARGLSPEPGRGEPVPAELERGLPTEPETVQPDRGTSGPRSEDGSPGIVGEPGGGRSASPGGARVDDGRVEDWSNLSAEEAEKRLLAELLGEEPAHPAPARKPSPEAIEQEMKGEDPVDPSSGKTVEEMVPLKTLTEEEKAIVLARVVARLDKRLSRKRGILLELDENKDFLPRNQEGEPARLEARPSRALLDLMTKRKLITETGFTTRLKGLYRVVRGPGGVLMATQPSVPGKQVVEAYRFRRQAQEWADGVDQLIPGRLYEAIDRLDAAMDASEIAGESANTPTANIPEDVHISIANAAVNLTRAINNLYREWERATQKPEDTPPPPKPPKDEAPKNPMADAMKDFLSAFEPKRGPNGEQYLAAGLEITPEQVKAAVRLVMTAIDQGAKTFNEAVAKLRDFAGMLTEQMKETLHKAWDTLSARKFKGVADRQGVTFDQALNPKQAEKVALGDGTFTPYTPERVVVEASVKHPADLVQTSSMAAARLPEPKFKVTDLKIDPALITSGAISDAQLEGIVMAINALETPIVGSDDTGADQDLGGGFLVGDGTGVGKTRQILGVLTHYMNSGHKKAVVLSAKNKLLDDLRSDAEELGLEPASIFSKGALAKPVKQEGGIAYLTYATAMRQGEAPAGLKERIATSEMVNDRSLSMYPRLLRLVEWLGRDFDGVIVLDEAHLAGNAVEVSAQRNASKAFSGARQAASKTGQGALAIQRALPKAKFIYASATIATEPHQTGLLERLGAWGPKAAFKDFTRFVNTIQANGIAAMEMVARGMKQSGRYIARSISMAGVSYQTLEHGLTPDQIEMTDKVAEGWRTVIENWNQYMEKTGASKSANARKNANSMLYGALQRFYQTYLTGLMMPSVIKSIQDDLAAGRSAVIQLVQTNAAYEARKISERQRNAEADELSEDESSLEEIDTTPRGVIVELVEKSFPTQLYEPTVTGVKDDGSPKIEMMPAKDENGNAIDDPDAVAARDALLTELANLVVPDAAINQFYSVFGADGVAEVTGRKTRIEDGKSVEVSNGEADFRDGNKRILLFSNAGGTGSSYHADRRFKNQDQRSHYLLQAGWEANKAIQGLGRTNRSNQSSSPVVRLVTTDLRSHKRFISTIARRIEQLGALTQGDRESGGGNVFSAMDNLESPEARAALQNYLELVRLGREDAIDPGEFQTLSGIALSDDTGRSTVDRIEMKTFLNRLMVFPVDTQNAIFDAFYDEFERVVAHAIETGTLDQGTKTLKAESLKELERHPVPQVDGVDYRVILAEEKRKPIPISLLTTANNLLGFYTDNDTGHAFGVRSKDHVDPESGKVKTTYTIYFPNGEMRTTQDLKALEADSKEIESLDEAQDAWEATKAAMPTTSLRRIHLVNGDLLKVWDSLPDDKGAAEIVRAILDNGEPVLGRVIRPALTARTQQALGVTVKGDSAALNLTPEQAAKIVTQSRHTVHLIGNNLPALALGTTRHQGNKRVIVRAGEMSLKQKQIMADRYGLLMEQRASDRVMELFVPSEKLPGFIRSLRSDGYRIREAADLEVAAHGLGLTTGSSRSGEAGFINPDVFKFPFQVAYDLYRGGKRAFPEWLKAIRKISEARGIWGKVKNQVRQLWQAVKLKYMNRGLTDIQARSNLIEVLSGPPVTGGEFVQAMHGMGSVPAFRIGDVGFKVSGGNAYIQMGEGMWQPVENPEDAQALYQSAAQDQNAADAQAFLNTPPRTMLQMLTGRSMQGRAIGKNFSSPIERNIDLPSRLEQKYGSTIGWVFRSIDRWHTAVTLHESQHAETRRTWENLGREESHRLFKFMASERFKEPTRADMAEARRILGQRVAENIRQVQEAEAALARAEVAATKAMEAYKASKGQPSTERFKALSAMGSANAAKGSAQRFLARRKAVLEQAQQRLDTANPRGKKWTAEELKAQGFTEKAAEVYQDTLEDFEAQIKELAHAARMAVYAVTADISTRITDLQIQMGEETNPLVKDHLNRQIVELEDQITSAERVANYYEELPLFERAYVPLVRTGNIAVKWFNKDGGLEGIVTASSEGQVRKKAEAALKEWPNLAQFKMTDPIKMNDNRSDFAKSPTLEDLQKAARLAGLDPRMADDLTDAYEALNLQERNARSFKVHLRHAEGLPGFEINGPQAHALYTQRAAKYKAHMTQGRIISRRIATLEEVHKQGASVNTEAVGYLKKLAGDVFNNPVSSAVIRVNQIADIVGLGANLGFMVQQMAQKLTHEVPVLRSIWRGKPTASVELAAFRIASAMILDKNIQVEEVASLLQGAVQGDANVLAKEVLGAMKVAEDEGSFIDEQTQETRNAAAGYDYGKRGGVERVSHKIHQGFFFLIRHSELHNRRQTFIAAYLLGRTLGFPSAEGFDPNQEPDKIGRASGKEYQILNKHAAYVLGEKMVDWIHNKRGATNRSQILRIHGGVYNVPLKFKYFQFEYPQMISRLFEDEMARYQKQGMTKAQAASKALVPVMQSQAILLGLAGMMGPWGLASMLDWLDWLWNEVLGPFVQGKGFKSSNTFNWRSWGWMPKVLKYGIPNMVGFNISRSVGMGDQLAVQRGDDYKDVLTKMAGATPGMLGQAARRHDPAALLPKGVSQAVRAIGDDKLHPGQGFTVPLTATERAMMAVGIKPASVAEAQDLAQQKKLESLNRASERKAQGITEANRAKRERGRKNQGFLRQLGR